jgi:hypothetical protein
VKKVPSTEQIVMVTLAASEQKQIQDYLNRGRRHRSVAEAELRDMFVERMREWVAGEGPAPTAFNDVESEFHARGLQPPFDLVPGELELISKRASEVIQALTPEDKDRINDEIFEEYENAMKRSQ